MPMVSAATSTTKTKAGRETGYTIVVGENITAPLSPPLHGIVCTRLGLPNEALAKFSCLPSHTDTHTTHTHLCIT